MKRTLNYFSVALLALIITGTISCKKDPEIIPQVQTLPESTAVASPVIPTMPDVDSVIQIHRKHRWISLESDAVNSQPDKN